MRKRNITRTIITVVIIVAVIGLIAYVLTNNKKKNEAKTAEVAQSSADVPVKIDTVKQESLNLDFLANGNFVAGQQINFSAENSGRVTRVLVDEGSYVKIGQTLAVIKADQQNIDLETAQASYQNAVRDRQRYENAFKTGGVTQQQLDQARLAVQNSESRLNAARIRVGDANIRSSINGIVNKRFIEPGAVVGPGTQLFEIVNVSNLKLNITVTEAQVAQLKLGDKLQVKASVYPDRTFGGTVSFIAPKADNSLNFPVEIQIASNPDNMLKAGMYGTALFSFPAQAPALTIPRSAFVGSVNSNKVFVIDQQNTARARQVVPGRTINDRVEILQGLVAGDKVISSGQINLSEGSKVAPIK